MAVTAKLLLLSIAFFTARTGHKLCEENHLLVPGSTRRLGWYSWNIQSHLVFLSILQALISKCVGVGSSTLGMHKLREEITYSHFSVCK